eukprot:594237-Ditylum_brightwellii.AAC.1
MEGVKNYMRTSTGPVVGKPPLHQRRREVGACCNCPNHWFHQHVYVAEQGPGAPHAHAGATA